VVASRCRARRTRRMAEFQSPSLRGSGRFGGVARRGPWRHRVSIPFIAGQWSLQARAARLGADLAEFQSPSLRGSGRFCMPMCRRPPSADVSIPFIAGQWSLHGRVRIGGLLLSVSIPFIAGQWSLPPERARRLEHQLEFQSPSLRGSGRFSIK